MAEFYRFRTAERLLGEHAELKRQTIFFAAPEDLNDPMEGLQDVVWVADGDSWRRLLLRYADFLHWHFRNAVTYGVEAFENPHGVPYAPGWQNSLDPQVTALSKEIVETMGQNSRTAYLAYRLGKTRKQVRRWELVLYFREMHAYCLDAARTAYVQGGVIGENDWPDGLRHHKTRQTPVEMLDQANESMDPTQRTFLSDMAFNERAHIAHVQVDSFGDKLHSMLWVPRQYVDYLASLVRPDWYTACFTTNINNSSMWAHYGDGHKGACLIFEIDDNADEPGLLLKKTDTDGGGDADEPTFKRMRLYRIRYGDRPSEVEFFAGQSPDPSRRDVTFKTTDWEYEQEYRLVLDRKGDEPLDVQARTLTYDFMALKGIAFGARMAEEDKAKIRKIIDDKRIEHDRQWFEYRDGYYSPAHGNIQITSASTALLSP